MTDGIVERSAPAPAPPADPAAGNPIRRILVARGLRDFGDGLVAVLLPAYLIALGFGAAEVGAVATIALAGSSLMAIGAGVLRTRSNIRLLLHLTAALMVASGLGFATAASFAAIVAIALVGTINPSAGSVSRRCADWWCRRPGGTPAPYRVRL
jgi:MFS family permease